ncbi:MAG: autotransporter-associated beta strand repeat-containing protein, partial [Verrucomicrobia bacterium]|nr:autotransporter-associated beta strand repeat-containing protein [Verrucomicrobiota bacterium]
RTWGSGGVVGTGGVQALILNSISSLAEVTFTHAIDLGHAARTVTVNDNAQTGADYASLTGVLSGTGGGLFKNGAGILRVGNQNSYTGITSVDAGTLVVSSLGSSTAGVTSSVGAGTVTMDDTNAIVLGNATTTGGNLQYVGPGETSDRKIRLRGTTANSAIYADGAGPLILTNVAHDTTETGNKTLSLRGTNTGGNMITSVLSNNVAGTLNVTVDGGATWILTNAGNTYTAGTSAGAGALGIGDDLALGTGSLTNTNGNVFAYGADRTIANALAIPNNVASGWLGDYSLTVGGITTLAAAANNITFNNSIVTGKALTLNGGVTANALTANRAWNIDGPGETVINGNFTTSTAFGVRFDVIGGGTLNLGTNGATSNFNQSITAVDVDRGTLKFSANNAIPTLAALSGGVTLTPELVNADTAKIDLNGTSQTFNAFTATSDGISIIDNSAAGAATLIVGANNTAATFGTGGVGTYSITQTGGGAINLGKIGTGTANFTGALGNTGTVTSNGGVLNLNSATGATGAVGDGGALNFKGGITTPGNLTTVTTNNGGLVSFASGLGTPFNNLGTLSLSLTANSGLELDVGDSGTDKLTSTLASVANVTTLFIKDTDITGGMTYDLIVNAGGGLGVLGNYLLNLPGYSGSTLTVTPNLVQLNAGTLVTSDVYWNNGTGLGGGTLTQAWNTVDGVTNNINFSGVVAGTPALQLNENLPGKGQKVIFQGDNITGGAPLATTLEQAFTVNTLEFRQSTTAANTSRTISIAPGAVGSNSLTAKPTLATDGINLQTGAVGTVSISAPFVAGANQTWTVADASVESSGGVIAAGTPTILDVTSTTGMRAGMTITGTGIPAGTTIVSVNSPTQVTLSASATAGTALQITAVQQLNMSGALSGSGNVTKAGAGRVVLSGANGTPAGTYTNSAGSTQVNTLSALGGLVGVPGSGSDITVTGGSFYYNNATAGTFVNDITLNGGALSAGGNNHIYSGSVNVSGNSFINMADSGGSALNTARSITLSGIVSGSGNLTIDSNNGLNGGNQLNGTLTLNNAGSAWTGDLFFNEGTVTLTNAVSPSFTANDVTFNAFGRLNLQGLNGATLTRTGTINYLGGAIGEFGVDNTGAVVNADFLVNQTGLVALGSGGTGGNVRIFLADAFSKLTISGGVTLGGNSSISVGGDAVGVATISGVIDDGASSYSLAVNNDFGGWGTTNRALHLSNANTYAPSPAPAAMPPARLPAASPAPPPSLSPGQSTWEQLLTSPGKR